MQGERRPLKSEVQEFTRTRILEEASRLFYERGYGGTTLDAIAARLDVAKPYLYQHFESKLQILEEICVRATSGATGLAERVAAMSGRPRERLAHLVRELVELVVAERFYISVYFREEPLLSEATQERVRENRRRFDRHLAALLAEGCEAGEMEIEDVGLATNAAVGLVSWLFTWYRPHGRLSPELLAERMTALVLRMVAAPAEAPPRAGEERGPRGPQGGTQE